MQIAKWAGLYNALRPPLTYAVQTNHSAYTTKSAAVKLSGVRAIKHPRQLTARLPALGDDHVIAQQPYALHLSVSFTSEALESLGKLKK